MLVPITDAQRRLPERRAPPPLVLLKGTRVAQPLRSLLDEKRSYFFATVLRMKRWSFRPACCVTARVQRRNVRFAHSNGRSAAQPPEAL
jgi:hypothetical protein